MLGASRENHIEYRTLYEIYSTYYVIFKTKQDTSVIIQISDLKQCGLNNIAHGLKTAAFFVNNNSSSSLFPSVKYKENEDQECVVLSSPPWCLNTVVITGGSYVFLIPKILKKYIKHYEAPLVKLDTSVNLSTNDNCNIINISTVTR